MQVFKYASLRGCEAARLDDTCLEDNQRRLEAPRRSSRRWFYSWREESGVPLRPDGSGPPRTPNQVDSSIRPPLGLWALDLKRPLGPGPEEASGPWSWIQPPDVGVSEGHDSPADTGPLLLVFSL
ncbi:hypothetical protein EYF80_044753 [Liparis tanakae]|uniref:Uncharacterized protein n=1 Tax=Liparis tanakae TaxID=230148 RepID=A0A4Z2FUV3_9TELE|nr:hypothetical protein EYF80_044753 [Liparis tanakae]